MGLTSTGLCIFSLKRLSRSLVCMTESEWARYCLSFWKHWVNCNAGMLDYWVVTFLGCSLVLWPGTSSVKNFTFPDLVGSNSKSTLALNLTTVTLWARYSFSLALDSRPHLVPKIALYLTPMAWWANKLVVFYNPYKRFGLVPKRVALNPTDCSHMSQILSPFHHCVFYTRPDAQRASPRQSQSKSWSVNLD